MKKTLSTIFSAAILAGALLPFTACKKGEEDPGISLRSRKARVEGEWTISSGETSSKNVQQDWWDDEGTLTSTTVSTYNGTSAIEETTREYKNYSSSPAQNNADTTTVEQDTSYFTMSITLGKDGSYEMIRKYDDPDDIYWYETTEQGTWAFAGGVGEVKNKEQIVFTTTYEIEKDYDGNSIDIEEGDTYSTDVWNIIRLANDEIILNQETSSGGGTSTNSSETSITYTLTQE